jgi:SHS2 domain-containing protein
MPYTMIDHTADIGIKVTSPTLKELYEEAARALVDIVGARSIPESHETMTIETQGIDREDLLVRWLQEILFLVEVRDFRIKKITVERLTDTYIRAQLYGEHSDDPLESEIKAVTYHNLHIREIDNGYVVSIIFDI